MGSRSSDSDEEVGIRKRSVFSVPPEGLVKMYEDVVKSKEILQAITTELVEVKLRFVYSSLTHIIYIVTYDDMDPIATIK